MHALAALKREDWPAVRERLTADVDTGFGFILSPLLKAWSYGGEKNIEKVEETLAPLLANTRLRSIALEHQAYIADYMDAPNTAELYEALIALERPASLQPVVAYGHRLYRAGQGTDARQIFADQLQRFDNNAFLTRQAALILRGQAPRQVVSTPEGAMSMVFGRIAGEFSQAQSYQTAVLYHRFSQYLTPDLLDVHYRLGELFEELNNPLSAAAEFAAVPRNNPLRTAAKRRQASSLLQASDFERGGRDYQ